MGGDFQLVALGEFDRVEQRIIHAFAFERDAHVRDHVVERRAREHGFAVAFLFCRFERALHEFFHALFFERGNFHDGHADLSFQFFRV